MNNLYTDCFKQSTRKASHLYRTALYCVSDCVSRAAGQCIDFPIPCDCRLYLTYFPHQHLPSIRVISTTICRSLPNEGRTRYLKTQKKITNKSAIDFVKKPALINRSSSSWTGISLFHRENTLCREKGLKLQAIYNTLLGPRNNEVTQPYLTIFIYIFLNRILNLICFKFALSFGLYTL